MYGFELNFIVIPIMHELLEPQDFKKILLHSSHSSTLSEVKSKVLGFMKILETKQIVLEFIATTSIAILRTVLKLREINNSTSTTLWCYNFVK